jgi:predicted nucleic acid-binding protein
MCQERAVFDVVAPGNWCKNLKRLRLYIETSVWNFYFADDAPEKRDVTIQLFDLVERGKYDINISAVVLEEISRASAEKQARLLQLIQSCHPKELALTEEVLRLADRYIQEQALPSRAADDAKHVAAATYYAVDALIGWNLKHLANLNKRRMIQSVNVKEGFLSPLEILTPMEVSNE